MAFPVSVDATWLNPSSVSLNAQELRGVDGAFLAGSAGSAWGGIVRHGDSSLVVSVDGSDVATVQPGTAVIPGNAAAGQGPYRVSLPSVSSGALAARNATNPRIDLVVLRVLDTDVVPSHGAYTGQLEVITGTPAAVPAAPDLPSMAVELGRVTVPAVGAGAASVSTIGRTYATAVGGVLVVPMQSQLPASAATYQRAIDLSNGRVLEYTGSAWAQVNPSPVWTTSAGGVNAPATTAWAAEATGGLTASITVPSSGRLRVSIAAYLYQSTAGKLTQWGMKLSGVTTRDPSAGEVLTVYGTAALRAGVTYLLSGLPSGSITLTSALLSDAGAASPYIASRSLLVEPA